MFNQINSCKYTPYFIPVMEYLIPFTCIQIIKNRIKLTYKRLFDILIPKEQYC